MGANVGNAYLEAVTMEKVCFIAGPEFGDHQGHTLIIYKALYGLKSSGLCWRESLRILSETWDSFHRKQIQMF